MSLLNERDTGITDQSLLLQAHLIADSFSPMVKNCTAYPNVYRDMVQAKLDALLFNEDAVKWIDNMLGLKPSCEVDLPFFYQIYSQDAPGRKRFSYARFAYE